MLKAPLWKNSYDKHVELMRTRGVKIEGVQRSKERRVPFGRFRICHLFMQSTGCIQLIFGFLSSQDYLFIYLLNIC